MIEAPATPVVVVCADDWEAIYYNGQCVHQHHHARLEDLQTYLPPEITLGEISEWYEDVFIDIAYDTGGLPDKLSELVEEASQRLQ